MNKIIKQTDFDCNGYNLSVRHLCREYPFIKQSAIGKTVMGQDIKALLLGNASDAVLYTAAIHGSERLTAMVLLLFVEELCQRLSSGEEMAGVDIARAFCKKGAVFVPVCNPDGCEISLKGERAFPEISGRLKRLSGGDLTTWNANARGVDLNHNFDADWELIHKKEREMGYYSPGPTRFGGDRPCSEPETAALCELCRKLDFRHIICLHSQGEVIYWNHNSAPDSNDRRMAEVFATSSGYALDIPVAVASGGGFKDWFCREFSRPGFTFEVGKGTNPLPVSCGDDIYLRIKEAHLRLSLCCS